MEYPELLVQAISNSLVVDPGSYSTKIGYSDQPQPQSDIISAFQNNQFYEQIPLQKQTHGDFYVQNGLFKPEQMQMFLQLVNKQYPLSQQPVIFTLPYYTPKPHKTKLAELLFEKFESPALYFYSEEASSAAASGIVNGLVLDLGYGKSSISAVVDGRTLVKSSSLFPITGESFLKDIPYNNENNVQELIERSEVFEELARFPDDSFKQTEYILPDNTKIKTEVPRSVEAFFNPGQYDEYKNLYSLEFAAEETVCELPDFIENEILEQILPVGGLSSISGFNARLKQEIGEVCGTEAKIKVVNLNNSLTDRKYSSFLGGSIIGSLGVFSYLWVSRGEWNEFGEVILSRRGVE